MTTEIQLGLCNPPKPVYLYVKNAELGGESYLWYRYDIEKDRTIPVQQRGLTGYLSELRMTAKEFKGKDNMKLDIVVSADELYIIRTGLETNFAKSFILATSLVQDFSKPLIIAATAGEENTVFCNLYDAVTKTKIKREWNKDADWASIIHDIQSLLGGTSSTIPPTPKLSVVNQINTLYLCWYISPPWGYCIPRVEVNLLERVYICTAKTFGYCCGVKWKKDRWIYAVVCNDDIIYATEHEIIGTGEIQLAALEKPVFVLGDRILLRSHNQGTRQRLILGIHLLNRSWFYYVEWMPPALEEVTSLDDRLAFVPQRDLVRVLF